jgi:hypothetical protein
MGTRRCHLFEVEFVIGGAGAVGGEQGDSLSAGGLGRSGGAARRRLVVAEDLKLHVSF